MDGNRLILRTDGSYNARIFCFHNGVCYFFSFFVVFSAASRSYGVQAVLQTDRRVRQGRYHPPDTIHMKRNGFLFPLHTIFFQADFGKRHQLTPYTIHMKRNAFLFPLHTLFSPYSAFFSFSVVFSAGSRSYGVQAVLQTGRRVRQGRYHPSALLVRTDPTFFCTPYAFFSDWRAFFSFSVVFSAVSRSYGVQAVQALAGRFLFLQDIQAGRAM